MIGTPLSPGRATAPLLLLDEPLSFWGGSDVATGEITDVHHPQRGARAAGRVLAFAASRGSSSSSTVLAEQIRRGAAPAAVLLRRPDAIVALAAIVARELYAIEMPVVVLSAGDFDALPRTGTVTVAATDEGAEVRIEEAGRR
ncbi:aconitase X swivel domain-containing protein [Actinomadura coerulea]|uniref:aconitase X swivel domain-containing protein n=1 Tax=Actinomadura coerulea TaxID=46159 RepID=UPI0034454B51